MPSIATFRIYHMTLSTNWLLGLGLVLIGVIDALLIHSEQTPYRAWLVVMLIIVIVLLAVLSFRMSEECRKIHD